MEYKVVLETFEGPLDLLLHLIEKAEVDIYDIPISKITDQYIEYLKNMQKLDLEVTSEFLVMASTLLEIKSKMLLPKTKSEDKNNEDKEETQEDPRYDLVKRLLEYKRYKVVSQKLREREKNQNKIFYKPQEDLSHIEPEEEDILEDLELGQLVITLNKILKDKNKNYEPINFDEIHRDEITLDECIKDVKDVLRRKGSIKFTQLFHDNVTRTEIVVTFLSILELVRLKDVTIIQEEDFSDILIVKTG